MSKIWRALFPVGLVLLLTALVLVACGRAAPAEPVEVAPQALAAGRIFRMRSTVITTTDVQSTTANVGQYGSAQIWMTVDISSPQTITPSLRMSDNASDWIEIYSWGPIGADWSKTVTTFTDIGAYLNVRFEMSNTEQVTPTCNIVAKR